ncbi:MAG: SCO family protein [Candidatus Didemnitutus sp.]|nr:SCO family protein [Candidatus Didemnitutus sp.]
MLVPAHAPATPPDAAESTSTRAGRFFAGPGLLVFLATAIGAYELFILFTIFWPLDAGWLGGFVRDFQVWCYGYDPRTGGMSWNSVIMMLLEPLFVVGVASILWRDSLRDLLRRQTWSDYRKTALAGLVVIGGAIAGLVSFAMNESAAALVLPPFPGESIRVRLPLPDVAMVDQKNTSFRFADLQGQVVLFTGVYSACTTACPEIFKEIRAVMAELTPAERAGVRVVALSLNPEYETAELMDLMADAQGLTYPEFRYVNGEKPAEMLDLLSRLQFARSRNPETGVIDHMNLIQLVDREGYISYRFTLEPRHRAWLREGLRSLLRDKHVPSSPAS